MNSDNVTLPSPFLSILSNSLRAVVMSIFKSSGVMSSSIIPFTSASSLLAEVVGSKVGVELTLSLPSTTIDIDEGADDSWIIN